VEAELTFGGETEDWAYFARRAREERDRAASCGDDAAAFAHLRLAREYERLARRQTEQLRGAL
jgi:hypothetical protein